MAINKKGISIVELLVVAAIVIIGLVGLLSVTVSSLKFSRQIREQEQAKALAEGALEAVRNFRDGTTWDTDGLKTLALDPVTYHPEKIGAPLKWTLVSGEETIGAFKRKVVFSKISRDPISKNIESTYNPSNDDPNTRKITATVSWQDKTVEISTLLTNWK